MNLSKVVNLSKDEFTGAGYYFITKDAFENIGINNFLPWKFKTIKSPSSFIEDTYMFFKSIGKLNQRGNYILVELSDHRVILRQVK